MAAVADRDAEAGFGDLVAGDDRPRCGGDVDDVRAEPLPDLDFRGGEFGRDGVAIPTPGTAEGLVDSKTA